jgi:hypothetical protein
MAIYRIFTRKLPMKQYVSFEEALGVRDCYERSELQSLIPLGVRQAIAAL